MRNWGGTRAGGETEAEEEVAEAEAEELEDVNFFVTAEDAEELPLLLILSLSPSVFVFFLEELIVEVGGGTGSEFEFAPE